MQRCLQELLLLPCPAGVQQRHSDETDQNKKALAVGAHEVLRKAKGGLTDPEEEPAQWKGSEPTGWEVQLRWCAAVPNGC